MKKILSVILALILLFSAPQVQARHHHNGFAAFVGGLVLGSVAVAAAVAESTPAPTIMYAQPVVVQQPMAAPVVQQPVVVQQPAPIVIVQQRPLPPPPLRPVFFAPPPPRFRPIPPPPPRFHRLPPPPPSIPPRRPRR